MILRICVVSVVMSPLLFLILNLRVGKVLSIFFFKSQLFSLIFLKNCLLDSISFISAQILFSSFGFLWTFFFFFSGLWCKVRLFKILIFLIYTFTAINVQNIFAASCKFWDILFPLLF